MQRFGPQQSVLPASVVVPWYTQFVGQGRRIAGQTGSRMGEHVNPFLVDGNPTEPDFRVRGLDLPSEGQGAISFGTLGVALSLASVLVGFSVESSAVG